MTNTELEKITTAIKEANKNAHPESSKLLDFTFKIISALSLALVGWTLTSVNSMQQDVVRLSSDAVYMRNSLEKLDNFTSQPRFTKEDFDIGITPMVTKMAAHELDITAIEKRLNTIDLKIQQLEIIAKKE